MARIKFLKISNYIYKNLLKLVGLFSICFVFEACYGSPQADFMPELNQDIRAKLESADSLNIKHNTKEEALVVDPISMEFQN